MNVPDLVNGSFEALGAVAMFWNIPAIIRDKLVRGVNPGVPVFFAAWGFWNLYYYPHLDQWMSFVGGILIVIANVTWISLVTHFRAWRQA